MNCPRCQTANPNQAIFCLSCGFKFHFEEVHVDPNQTNLKNGLAMTSLVLGGISLLTCSLFFIGAFAAMAFGVMAIVKANSDPDEYGGKGLAMTGIAMSVVAILAGSFIAFRIIPGIVNSEIAVNEANVAQHVYNVGYSQYEFHQSKGRYGTIEELNESGVIDGNSLKEKVTAHGYKIEVKIHEESFEIRATPVSYGWTGRRSFYMSNDYRIRAADKRGVAASNKDPIYY